MSVSRQHGAAAMVIVRFTNNVRRNYVGKKTDWERKYHKPTTAISDTRCKRPRKTRIYSLIQRQLEWRELVSDSQKKYHPLTFTNGDMTLTWHPPPYMVTFSLLTQHIYFLGFGSWNVNSAAACLAEKFRRRRLADEIIWEQRRWWQFLDLIPRYDCGTQTMDSSELGVRSLQVPQTQNNLLILDEKPSASVDQVHPSSSLMYITINIENVFEIH